VDTGTGEGAARVSNYVTSLMATAPEMLKSVSGIDLDQLVKELISKKAPQTKTRTPKLLRIEYGQEISESLNRKNQAPHFNQSGGLGFSLGAAAIRINLGKKNYACYNAFNDTFRSDILCAWLA